MGAKGAKRSVKIWTRNFYKSFFKNKLWAGRQMGREAKWPGGKVAGRQSGPGGKWAGRQKVLGGQNYREAKMPEGKRAGRTKGQEEFTFNSSDVSIFK